MKKLDLREKIKLFFYFIKENFLPLDLILIFLFAFAGVYITVHSVSNKKGKIVVVAAGQRYEYSAENNGVFEVEGEIGTTVFEIKDCKVRIIDSPCKNKTCVCQGWHSPLVCLPNNVIITLENGDSEFYGEYDAVSE